MAHKMSMVSEHEGTEEWLCPICGRRLLIEWSPEFRKKVVDEGDESVQHSGGKGLIIGDMEIEK